MKCPACSGQLGTTNYLNLSIQQCGSCHGTWVCPSALKKIAETPLINPDSKLVQDTLSHEFKGILESDRKRVIQCPTCKVPLQAHNYGYASGIIIDSCPNCRGVWLDDEEIQKVEIYEQAREEDEKKHFGEWSKIASDAEASVKQDLRQARLAGMHASVVAMVHPFSAIHNTVQVIRQLKKD